MKSLFLTLFLLSLNAIAAKELEIIKLGHPTLRATAQEVHYSDITSSRIQTLIDDMIFTMSKAGGVGLAAPQVNESLRLFVMKSWPSVPLTVVINPKVEYIEESGMKDSSEGCLSIPGKTYKVKRYKKIRISYYDRDGKYHAKELNGFGAIIAQHEYDHLDGVMILDLIENLNSEFITPGYSTAPLM